MQQLLHFTLNNCLDFWHMILIALSNFSCTWIKAQLSTLLCSERIYYK